MAASLHKADIVARVAATIRAHYAEPVTLSRIAASVGRHPNYIGLLFQEQMGLTVRAYLTRCRLERAADLISRGDKIEAVSLCVGYRSKTNLYRQFKRYFGVTPEHYRDLQSGEPASIGPDGVTPERGRAKRTRRYGSRRTPG